MGLMALRCSFRLLGMACCAVAVLAAQPAASQTLRKITFVQAHANIGVGEEVFVYAVPKHFGWFAEEGLDVDIQGVAGGTLAAQVLQGGSAQVASVAPESVMIVRDKGGDIKSFASLRRKGGWQVAVKQGSPIRTLADLKGKNLGVQGMNSGVVPLLRSSLADAGMQPTDYSLLATGSGPQAAAALTSGKIDALVLWDAEYGKMENNGLQLAYIDLPIVEKLAGFTLASTGKFIKENPKALVGFCRAMAKGQVFSRANPAAAIKIFYDMFPQTRPKGVPEEQAIRDDANILKRWLMGGTGSDPSVAIGWQYPEKWAFTLKHYSALGQITNPKPVEEYYTNEFMKECNNFDHAKIAGAALAAK